MTSHRAVLLVDGNNIAWRAASVISLERFMEEGDDLSLQLLDNMLSKREREMADDGYTEVSPLVTFDAGYGEISNDAKIDRYSFYEEYKANRKDDHTNPERTELDRLRTNWKNRWRDALLDRGVPTVEHKCVEADDLMSYGADIASAAEGVDAAIWTADKDLMQCVRDDEDRKTIMYRLRAVTVKGKRKMVERLVDGNEVMNEKGVPPEKVRMQLALAGDTADNYAGIKGYGGKLGLKLVNKANDIQDLVRLLKDSMESKKNPPSSEEVDKSISDLMRNWTLAGCGRDWMPSSSAEGVELAVDRALSVLDD